jgi:hypothetical protein
MNVLGLMLDLDRAGFWEPYMHAQREMKIQTGELLHVHAAAQQQLQQDQQQQQVGIEQQQGRQGLLQRPALCCAVVHVLAETLLLFTRQKPGIISLRVMAHMVTKVRIQDLDSFYVFTQDSFFFYLFIFVFISSTFIFYSFFLHSFLSYFHIAICACSII